ncbi:hypothetical protein ACQP2K_16275 [Microbispora siamensis]
MLRKSSADTTTRPRGSEAATVATASDADPRVATQPGSIPSQAANRSRA